MANYRSRKRKESLAKRKMKNVKDADGGEGEDSYRRMRLPRADELEQFGVVTQLMGANQIKALCEDGEERNLRIPGKMKKRFWIRENDVVIVKLWDFQPSKGDIVWRYMGNQVSWLKRQGKLDKLPI
jgi:translation initiation factor 1A